MSHLTSDNFPHYLLQTKTLKPNDFEYVENEELIKGKSIIVNKAGLLWLYMSDDHRKDKPQQIIVKKIGHFEMAFLSIESKKPIKLLNYKYV